VAGQRGSARARGEGTGRRRPHGKPNSRAVILQRRRLVARLLIRGVGPSEILIQLRGEGWQVSERTIFRDIAAVQRQWAKQVNLAKDAERAVQQLLVRSLERNRQAWQLYHETTNDSVKASVLRQLREEDAHILSVLQSLGALPKEPDRLVTEQGWEVRLRELRAQQMAQNKGISTLQD